MDKNNFDKLKSLLDSVGEWPRIYQYKFIVPNDRAKLDNVLNFFSNQIDVKSRKSKNSRFVALTITEVALNSDEIIEKYKKISEINDVMIL